MRSALLAFVGVLVLFVGAAQALPVRSSRIKPTPILSDISTPTTQTLGASSPSSSAPGAATAANVMFNGTTTASWIDESASANRIQEVPDPTGAAGDVLRLTADNSDVWPLTPTDNPRAQLVTPKNIVKANVPFWESYEVYLPSTFPVAETSGGWVALGSPFYGAPWNGTPPVSLEITNGDFLWQANADAPHPWQVLWKAPVVLGRWIRFTWYVVPSANGFAELYVDGLPVAVKTGTSTTLGVSIPVIDQTNDAGPWNAQLSVYYEHNEFPSVTVYFKDFVIGSTYQAATGDGLA